MRTFVFAIGGTGARVLRSLLMTLAADMDIETNEIIPLCIDLDENNGDLARTLSSLKKYRSASRELQDANLFFKNKIGTLGSLAGQEKAEGIGDNFKLDFGNINESFYNYVSGASLDKGNKDLLELLYDDSPSSNPNTELNLTLDMGFKGNPNIGCVVFNDIINSPEYRFFESIFADGDRIFIVSSIFGGTGSSGFPQLVENFRHSTNNHVKNALIGALVVKPYFKVMEDVNSTINSDMFNSKTKAALRYYKTNLNAVANMYYIGDTATQPYENIMGGSAQKNNAHLVEFIGAQAVLHFINSRVEANVSNFYEFGMEGDANDTVLSKNSFYKGNERFWIPFTKLAIFVKIHQYVISNYSSFDTFFTKLAIRKTDTHIFNDMNSYFKEYINWLSEMSINSKSLKLYNLSINDDVNSLVEGETHELTKLSSTKILRDLISGCDKTSGSKFQRYVKVINTIIDKHYESLLN